MSSFSSSSTITPLFLSLIDFWGQRSWQAHVRADTSTTNSLKSTSQSPLKSRLFSILSTSAWFLASCRTKGKDTLENPQPRNALLPSMAAYSSKVFIRMVMATSSWVMVADVEAVKGCEREVRIGGERYRGVKLCRLDRPTTTRASEFHPRHDSLTDRVCNLLCRSDGKNEAIFAESHHSSASAKGSKGGEQRASSTTGKYPGGAFRGLRGHC
ncbi:hypothetical protein EYF80_049026 [Liparis tanakae]|uniref:Uncharacterized protein n=1 Tax=Liparis tanakae TaxID=230148 RepID=A0A4Z2FJ63_9TELE|nr:hypothetical protein EYF80_049026 [Liparis tanakae]